MPPSAGAFPGVHSRHAKSLRQFVRQNPDQLHVILPEHTDVNIIIPRYEALVAHRAKQGTVVRKILQMMPLTYILNHA